MLSDLQIEALAHGCAKCAGVFKTTHLVTAAYFHSSVKTFEAQVEIGLIGQNVRNLWLHFDCDKPTYASWNMTPDIHICIRCKKRFAKDDVVQPVFQIIDPRAVNPSDPTDVGLALNERVYFVHAECKNAGMNKKSSNIILV